jgi:hypothetical protein
MGRRAAIGLCFLLTLAGTSLGQPDEHTVTLLPKQSFFMLVEFPAKHKAQATVKSEKTASDVDLFFSDATGKIIASDTSFGPNCQVDFTTGESPTVLLLKLINLGPEPARCTVAHNGKNASGNLQPLAKVAAGKKEAFFLHTSDGDLVTLRGGFKANVSMSVYDLDNNKIASDPKGNFVAWENKTPKIVRVVLANNGKEEAIARLTESAVKPRTTALPAFELKHAEKKSFELTFPAESVAAIWVTSEKSGDVDLLVYDKDGKEVASDITIGKDCFVGWLPAAGATYRVVVLNNGVEPNRCVLKHSGEMK